MLCISVGLHDMNPAFQRAQAQSLLLSCKDPATQAKASRANLQRHLLCCMVYKGLNHCGACCCRCTTAQAFTEALTQSAQVSSTRWRKMAGKVCHAGHGQQLSPVVQEICDQQAGRAWEHVCGVHDLLSLQLLQQLLLLLQQLLLLL